MKLRNAIAAAALALISVPAFADIVELSNVTGTWVIAPGISPLPTGCCTINNTSGGVTTPSTIRWGIPFPPNDKQSGYNFTVANPPPLIDFVVPPSPSAIELLGTFDHLNFPITDPFLQSVQLDVFADVAISTDGGVTFVSQGGFNFFFDFTHDETPNDDDPCKYGGANHVGVNINGCADKVTVSANNLSQSFTVGGTQYTLDILGFSQDGGKTISSSFLTTENQENTANLYADVRTVTTTVPEPASLALLGLGLLAASFVRRKSRTDNTA